MSWSPSDCVAAAASLRRRLARRRSRRLISSNRRSICFSSFETMVRNSRTAAAQATVQMKTVQPLIAHPSESRPMYRLGGEVTWVMFAWGGSLSVGSGPHCVCYWQPDLPAGENRRHGSRFVLCPARSGQLIQLTREHGCSTSVRRGCRPRLLIGRTERSLSIEPTTRYRLPCQRQGGDYSAGTTVTQPYSSGSSPTWMAVSFS